MNTIDTMTAYINEMITITNNESDYVTLDVVQQHAHEWLDHNQIPEQFCISFPLLYQFITQLRMHGWEKFYNGSEGLLETLEIESEYETKHIIRGINLK